MSASDEKDYYRVLGASDDAPREEIGRRYKRRAAELHPDRGGNEDEMKDLNEAYRVLGDSSAREAYDARRRSRIARDNDAVTEFASASSNDAPFVPVSSPAAHADAVWGRAAGAGLTIFLGLVLLFLVRTHYVVFLFPLALLAFALVFFGVWMAHAAMAYAREQFAPTHFARRSAWAQEMVFWSAVVGGVGVVYLLLTAL